MVSYSTLESIGMKRHIPVVLVWGSINEHMLTDLFILTQVYTSVKQVLIPPQHTLLLVSLPVLLEDSYSFYEIQNVIPL